MIDSIPLFFDDELGPSRKKVILKQLPPTPETGWRPPTHFPNLSAAKMLSFDVETWEPDFDHGPGWARGHGHIVGVGIGADDGNGNTGKWYFPVRHEVEPQYNLDSVHVFNFARDSLERTPRVPKVGANLTYDIGWLAEENIHVQGELHDVQFAEALLSEESEVALGALGVKYLNENKSSDLMYRWQAEAYGGAVNSKQRANIYRTSPRLVGHYGEGDVDLPLRILRHQWPLMSREGLLDVYRMECDLIYLMVKMRRKGVSIDVAAAERLYAQLGLDLLKFNRMLQDQLGFAVNVNAPTDVAKAFDHLGVPYKRTPDGNPSFTKDFLKAVDHPVAKQIIELRMYDKMRSTFVKKYLLERHSNGKIHGTFNQLRSDNDGTKVGRFSGSDPNLQNIPIRPGYTEEPLLTKKHALYDPNYVALGKRIRALFIHDAGHIAWEKNDFSQIQYRYLVHYAVGPGSDEVRAEYCLNPDTDYHDITQKTVERVTGLFIERKPIKNINFGLLFGMGEDKLARQIGVDKAKARLTFNAYHQGAPYVKATTNLYSNLSNTEGEIVSLLGRKSRFTMWEPIRQGREERRIALPYERAVQQYGTRIQRAYGHKALNRLLQMGEGDHMKRGMWKCYKDGVFDVIGVPRLTVHDELGFSVEDDSPLAQSAYAYMHHTLESAVPLRIPVRVDFGRGPNWGAIE
jgi:DNA polymerase I-like protein with 3'-5' exonuclease and polymerase domains